MSFLLAIGLTLVSALAVALVENVWRGRRAARRRQVPPCGCGERHTNPVPYPADTDPEGE